MDQAFVCRGGRGWVRSNSCIKYGTTSSMDTLGSYKLRLYSDDIEKKFQIADRVFVWLKSDKSTGLATVLQTPDSLSCDSPFAGRYLLKYDINHELTAHVRPERMFPVYTEQKLLLVCYHTECYRRLARSQVTCNDRVLEIGSSYGMCTNILSEHARHVIGLDNSEEAVAEARRRYPHIQFEVADVLGQPAAVLNLVKNSSSIESTKLDSSSSSKSCSVTAASNLTGPDISPAATEATGDDAAIRDAATNNPAAPADGTASHASEPHNSSSDAQDTQFRCCCSSSNTHSTSVVSSCCNVVFVDIGGNRQLEALLRLIPWVLQHLQPRLLVVKSEELAQAASQQLYIQQQQQQQQHKQQQDPDLHHDVQQNQRQIELCNASLCTSKLPTHGNILQPGSWWKQLEVQAGLNSLQHIGAAEPWFVNAKAQGFVRNPLRYPQRFTQEGVKICRPHNYDRCLKIDTCEFDHVHCHHWGIAGHRALECPVN